MFKDIKSVHILGIGGTLMGAFAVFLKRRGIKVTGTDEKIYPPMSHVLANDGISTFEGYRPENLKSAGNPDLVVIGNVIRRDNPEATAVVESGRKYTSLPEFMERYLLQSTTNILACGTHGKTTTSSMLAHTLKSCGKDPSFFIGGASLDLPHSFVVSESGSPYFVLEGDEYDTAYWDKVPKFNHYCPDHVILTSVEYDHADIYPSFEAVKKAFRGLVDRIRDDGVLVACAEYPEVLVLVERAKKRGLKKIWTYGSEGSPSAQVFFRKTSSGFEVLERESPKSEPKKLAEIQISMSGEHNILNALATWIELTRGVGLAPDAVAKALANFQGVRRRLETRGTPGDRTVIDDFAHHPTAVMETLKALRSRYPGKKLIAVFEPRSATSRRSVFQTEYTNAFDLADLVFLSRPYDQTRIPESERFSVEKLSADLGKRGRTVEVFDDVDQGVQQIAKKSQPGDIIVVMSNGGFGGLIPKLLEILK